MTWRWVIEGAPMAKPRPRFGRGRTYNPKSYQAWLTEKTQEGVQNRPQSIFGGPVGVRVVFHTKTPQNGFKRLLGRFNPKRPDLDNYVKAILDLITHVGDVWRDDNQVCELRALKIYGGHRPRTEVEVWDLEED